MTLATRGNNTQSKFEACLGVALLQKHETGSTFQFDRTTKPLHQQMFAGKRRFFTVSVDTQVRRANCTHMFIGCNVWAAKSQPSSVLLCRLDLTSKFHFFGPLCPCAKPERAHDFELLGPKLLPELAVSVGFALRQHGKHDGQGTRALNAWSHPRVIFITCPELASLELGSPFFLTLFVLL